MGLITPTHRVLPAKKSEAFLSHSEFVHYEPPGDRDGALVTSVPTAIPGFRQSVHTVGAQ